MTESQAQMDAKPIRRGAEVAAIHEAGHAVAAVYLGIPVDQVKLKTPWERLNDPSDLSGGEVSYLPTPSPMLTERATVAAAARVAVDTLVRFGAHPETAYSDDEDCLRQIAAEMEIAESDFRQWRSAIVERAREIVNIEYVRAAILRVASDLQATLQPGNGLTGEQVRGVLQQCKTAQGS
jgi:hypothetical protein